MKTILAWRYGYNLDLGAALTLHPQVPRGLCEPHNLSGICVEEKVLALVGNSTLTVEPLACRYTD
jgi:hypothetical protein